MKRTKKLTLFELVALGIAFFGSIRNIPQVGGAGWASIVWMALIVIFFAIPIGLLAAELGTSWAKRGGIATWVRTGLGERSGSIVSWLIWTQMFIGMAFISVALATAFTVMIDDPYPRENPYQLLPSYGSLESHTLADDPIFIVLFVTLITWLIIGINLLWPKATAKIQNLGTIFGIYIPAACFVVFGIIFVAMNINGISEQHYTDWKLGDLFAYKITDDNGNVIRHVPDFKEYHDALLAFKNRSGISFIDPSNGTDPTKSLSNFSNILFIFVGIEIAATRANDIDNPQKNYPIGLFITLLFMILINVVGGLLTSFIITPGFAQHSLATFILLPFQVIFSSWHAQPLLNFMALFLAFGTFAQLSAWVLGPSNAMYQMSIEGNYPKFFQKKFVRGETTIPINIILIQGMGITFFGLLYGILSAVGAGNVFGLFLGLTVDVYMVAYIFMIISAVRMRYMSSTKDVKRPFRLGKRGNAIIWLIATMAMIGVLFAIAMTFVPSAGGNWRIIQTVVLIAGVGILVGSAVIISLFKKPSWRNEVELAAASEATNVAPEAKPVENEVNPVTVGASANS